MRKTKNKKEQRNRLEARTVIDKGDKKKTKRKINDHNTIKSELN